MVSRGWPYNTYDIWVCIETNTSLRRIWLGWVSCSLFPIENKSHPTKNYLLLGKQVAQMPRLTFFFLDWVGLGFARKMICFGKEWPKCHVEPNFFLLGWPWVWELSGFIIQSNPTVFDKSQTPLYWTTFYMVFLYKLSFYEKRLPRRILEKCVCPFSVRNSEPTRWFSQMTPDEHPWLHHLADCPHSSLYALSPSLSSYSAASVMMCCSALPVSLNAPSVLP